MVANLIGVAIGVASVIILFGVLPMMLIRDLTKASDARYSPDE